MSNGTRAVSQFVKRIKCDGRVVDGVVSLKNHSIAGGAVVESVDFNEITVSGDGVDYDRAEVLAISVEVGVEYTLKSSRQSIVGSAKGTIFIADSGGTILETLLLTSEETDELAFTPTVDNIELWFVSSWNDGITRTIRYYNCKLFKGTTEPTSQQPVIGNSIINLTSYYDLLQSDALTTTTQFVDNLPVPYEITGSIVDNPLFIQATPFQLIQYSDTMAGAELAKILKYMKLD